jgi:hypothetical protein
LTKGDLGGFENLQTERTFGKRYNSQNACRSQDSQFSKLVGNMIALVTWVPVGEWADFMG